MYLYNFNCDWKRFEDKLIQTFRCVKQASHSSSKTKIFFEMLMEQYSWCLVCSQNFLKRDKKVLNVHLIVPLLIYKSTRSWSYSRKVVLNVSPPSKNYLILLYYKYIILFLFIICFTHYKQPRIKGRAWVLFIRLYNLKRFNLKY